MIAVAGATGFVGSALVARLRAFGRGVRCLSRRPDDVADCDAVEADVLDADSLVAALDGVDAAYYLVHSLGGRDFARDDAAGARNFAAAARANGVRRIVYLGGLAHGDELSEHMRSRHDVGRILADSGVATVELRASIVIGRGSLSFEVVRALVDTLSSTPVPLRLLPSWADARCQPLALDDLVEYLVRALDVPAGVYEIGGADVLTYRDLVAAYGDETGRGGIAVSVPLPAALADAGIPSAVAALAPGAGTVTATAQLVESLRFDSTVHESRDDVFGVAPRGVREAIREAVG